MNRVADPRVDPPRLRIAYDGTATPVKTALFLIVCAAWLLPGLVGHDPWKTDEAVIFGIVSEMLRTGDWVVPHLAGEPFAERAPLIAWVAALFVRAFGGILPAHDAARLASGLFMAVTLAGISAAAVALHGRRAGRIAVLLLIGCLGLLIRAHEMSTDLAGLAGLALGLAGLALASSRPIGGGILAGAGTAIAFLGDGFAPAMLLLALLAALPLAGSKWRTREYAIAAGVALLVAIPVAALWPALLWQRAPETFSHWLAASLATRWSGGITRGALADFAYFPKMLAWYAWPALPLAAWTIWRARRTLASREDLRLALVAAAVFLAALVLVAEAREVNAMPLLLPLVLLGVAELDSLPRGAASALDWFGVTTFALVAIAIWAGWAAAMTGSPAPVAEWLAREVPGYRYPFRFVPFTLAALLTCIWIVVVARSLRTTRRAVVNWSAGITMIWMLTMTLGLPLVDQARSYRGISAQLREALGGPACTIGVGVGDAQRALLDYFIGLRLVPPESRRAAGCDTLLVQQVAGREMPFDASAWRETWRGSRPGDRSESFVLFRRAGRAAP
jgi:4-amino-4-deoxy-L-arabinose transferase-like glycosyltransferase